MNYGHFMLRPPIASSRPETTVLHGRRVTDPYAWIADPAGNRICLHSRKDGTAG